MAQPSILLDVLSSISQAQNMDELRATVGAASKLSEGEKDIARWAYQYAQTQLKETNIQRRQP